MGRAGFSFGGAILQRVPARTLLLAGGALALTAAVSVAQAHISWRLLLLAVAVTAVLIAAPGTDLGVRLAICTLPFTALLRRITAGPSAYVYNDPLALLPIALLIPACLSVPRTRPGTVERWMTYLATWLIASSVFGVLKGSSPTVVGYGLATQLLPLLIGIQVATGAFRSLPRFLLQALPLLAALGAVYGIGQWLSPSDWDLAWLRTQQQLLTSVGLPVAGEFRIFGPMESPGALAQLLGSSAAVLGVTLAQPRGSQGLLGVTRLAVVVACIVTLALTSVRTALFALPVAILVVLALDRRISRAKLAPIVGVLSASVLVLPTFIADSTTEAGRYDLTALGQDQSFQDRSRLLQQFSQAATQPFGNGVGTTGLAGRLSAMGPNAADVQNIDNGYLSRLMETGFPGLVIFAVVVVLALRAVATRLRDGMALPADAGAAAIVVFFLLTDLAGPNTASALALFFWIAVGALAHRPWQDLQFGSIVELDRLDSEQWRGMARHRA